MMVLVWDLMVLVTQLNSADLLDLLNLADLLNLLNLSDFLHCPALWLVHCETEANYLLDCPSHSRLSVTWCQFEEAVIKIEWATEDCVWTAVTFLPSEFLSAEWFSVQVVSHSHRLSLTDRKVSLNSVHLLKQPEGTTEGREEETAPRINKNKKANFGQSENKRIKKDWRQSWITKTSGS